MSQDLPTLIGSYGPDNGALAGSDQINLKTPMVPPEIKAARACMDVFRFYCSVKGIEGRIAADCNFTQLSEPVDGVLPSNREFKSNFTSDLINIEIYGKCLDENTCEYYLCYNGEKYFIGTDINVISIADTFDVAKMPF